jgi:pimeloyl-ACP methyl ester carboxylesterase
MRQALIALLCGSLLSITSPSAFAADAPRPEAFRVLAPQSQPGPEITPYLKYQTEMAWQQDDRRRKEWEKIESEQDLLRVQQQLRGHLLAMIGGLPSERTPLHARTTGTIQMDGFHIEKTIYESLPHVYVTALVYVPEEGTKRHPAVLVPSGHSANGKAYYQALCQRLVQRGYVVISWDPIGQGERSQFWDAKSHKSRYNLICAEHAVLGNLAYLAGTNLARWEIWEGVRAVDYLLTRADVDPDHISITGTSGGGFQAAHIAALDPRIKVAAPSCYITALPMRIYNRIFKDPDSDPEQDLYGMISNGVDHPGLLLMMYPRPVFVAAAVLDFFPIEGTHKTFDEIERLYAKFGHADRIASHEGYHGHQFSDENQETALDFLDRFNGMPRGRGLPPVKVLDDVTVQCTQTGQIMLDYPDARSLMDVIRDYYIERKHGHDLTVKQLYFSDLYPEIRQWKVLKYDGAIPGDREIKWEFVGSSQFDDIAIDRYVLHHSRYLEMPLVRIHKTGGQSPRVMIWLGEDGKAGASDWPDLKRYVDSGTDIVSFDPRGMGETRMAYIAVSQDDPTLGQMDFDHAYVNPLSSVLADYVYNSILTGRPYFLQMIEDVEIATRFVREKSTLSRELSVSGKGTGYTLASAASETLPNLKLVSQPGGQVLRWSELVEQRRELWPIEDLLPAGAYIH